MILQDIINIIESVAPLSYQATWDNSGLQVGDRNADIHAALLTVDITESVVNEAIAMGCDLIISHHPLLFHGLKHLTGATPQERCVEQAIRHRIAIYSSHTSMDSWLNGVSGRMAEKIGILDYRILQPSATNPSAGLGVIGVLPQSMNFTALLQRVADAFTTDGIGLRYVPTDNLQVQNIALCGGAGADLMEDAIAQGADVFISADFKYHELQTAQHRIGIIDLDHWVSEHYTRELFEQLLSPHIRTFVASQDASPVKYFHNSKIE